MALRMVCHYFSAVGKQTLQNNIQQWKCSRQDDKMVWMERHLRMTFHFPPVFSNSLTVWFLSHLNRESYWIEKWPIQEVSQWVMTRSLDLVGAVKKLVDMILLFGCQSKIDETYLISGCFGDRGFSTDLLKSAIQEGKQPFLLTNLLRDLNNIGRFFNCFSILFIFFSYAGGSSGWRPN